jgi:cell division ATPase FtsA
MEKTMAFVSDDKVQTRKVLLTLDEETVEILRKAGDGNASLGARRIAKDSISTPRKSVVAHAETKLVEKTRRVVNMLTEEAYVQKRCRERGINHPTLLLGRRLREEYYSEYLPELKNKYGPSAHYKEVGVAD